MSKEKKKTELTEDQLAKIAGGDDNLSTIYVQCRICGCLMEVWADVVTGVHDDNICVSCKSKK